MNDGRMSAAGTREVFEAIVSQLDDPELVQGRRRITVMAVALFLAAAAVTLIGGMGWQTLLAFSSTFVPSVIVLWRTFGRRFAPREVIRSPVNPKESR